MNKKFGAYNSDLPMLDCLKTKTMNTNTGYSVLYGMSSSSRINSYMSKLESVMCSTREYERESCYVDSLFLLFYLLKSLYSYSFSYLKLISSKFNSIEEDIRKCKGLSCPWIIMNNIVKIRVLPITINRFKAISIKIQNNFSQSSKEQCSTF